MITITYIPTQDFERFNYWLYENYTVEYVSHHENAADIEIGGTFTAQEEADINTFYQTFTPDQVPMPPTSDVQEISAIVAANNDEIINPQDGDIFQLVDSQKTSGYGNASNQLTYFQPNDGEQSTLLDTKLDYGRSFAVHSEVNSTNLNMLLHESLVAEIYNKDVSGIPKLIMLFDTTNARGCFSKVNQLPPAGAIWNWNGQAIPDTNDPNELNPTEWVAPDGTVTTDWDNLGNVVARATYSTGALANRGSALLARGDVVCDNTANTSYITYDTNSDWFVMPIRAGGGTFNDMKVFQFFMSRKYKHMDDWDSYRFDLGADCIGTLLKIAYDGASEAETLKDTLVTCAENNNSYTDFKIELLNLLGTTQEIL